jgi:hypothetical protein
MQKTYKPRTKKLISIYRFSNIKCNINWIPHHSGHWTIKKDVLNGFLLTAKAATYTISFMSGIFLPTYHTAYIKAGHLDPPPFTTPGILILRTELGFTRSTTLCARLLALHCIALHCIGNAMVWSCKGTTKIIFLTGRVIRVGDDGLRCAWLPVCHSSRATTQLLMLPTMDGVHGAKHISVSKLRSFSIPFSHIVSFRVLILLHLLWFI